MEDLTINATNDDNSITGKIKRKKELLDDLESISKPLRGKSFSVKNLNNDDDDKEEKDSEEIKILDDIMIESIESDINSGNWDNFVDSLQELQGSPIDDIADENISFFNIGINNDDAEDNKYSKVFNKELAMLSEVLKDVKTHGTRVNNELKKMGFNAKSTSSRSTGIPKGYSDLVEAYNSINTSKVQIIKAMSDLKSKQMEWALKDKANQGPDSENTDNIADLYYKKIINGGTNNFIKNSANGYESSNFDYDPIMDSQSSDMNMGSMDGSNIDSLVISNGFNITQPLRGSKYYQNNDSVIGDEFGYISNEQNDYEICVYQYGDNQYQFAALDRDGEPLDGIELPSDSNPDIVNSLQIRPGSDFIYDKYGRKYRLIEMGAIDTSDIDDMDYPY